MKLPPVEGIVVLNISSWGGGCRPWMIGANGNTNVPEQKYVISYNMFNDYHNWCL